MTIAAGSVVGVGIDLADPRRIERALVRTPGLARRLFTPTEQHVLASGGPAAAAAMFAVKEAVMKALGGGLDTIGFVDIDTDLGPPARVRLSGRAADRARSQGAVHFEVGIDPGAGAERVVVAEVVARGADDRTGWPRAGCRPADG